MSFFNRLRGVVALLAAFLMVAPPPVVARTRKGDKLVKAAQLAESQHQYDKALALFEEALSQDPQDPGYLLGMRRVRFEAGETHVEQGLRLRGQGQLDQALVEFQKAFSTDPSSSIAVQEMRN